jgi:hypothetical protein
MSVRTSCLTSYLLCKLTPATNVTLPHYTACVYAQATAAQALPPNKATVVMPATHTLPEQQFAPCSPRRRTLTPHRSGEGGTTMATGMSVQPGSDRDGTNVERRTAVFQRQIAQADLKGITGATETRFNAPWGQQQQQVAPHVAAAQARVVPRVGGPASSYANGSSYLPGRRA